MTVANVVIGSQLTYRAVDHMETVQFCGQSCHVMKPEFTAHLLGPHQEVSCAGLPRRAWRDRVAASRRWPEPSSCMEVTFNTFPRPIESAMESNRLVSSAAHLRAVSCARAGHWTTPARQKQLQG